MKSERRLRWQDAAVRDLEEIHSYLFQNNPAAAVRFAEMILEAADQLLVHPEMGPPVVDLNPPGRYRGLTRGRYRLIYRVDSEVIWLLRVWDTRQDPARLKPED